MLKPLSWDFRFADLNKDMVPQYYRLQKIHERSIDMAKEDEVLYNATSGTGLALEDEKENSPKSHN